MAYRLIILNGAQRGERWDVENAPLVMGRAPEAGLRLDDPDAAPRHAELTATEAGLLIRCLGESDSIQVNGTSIHEATLRHGDVAQVGTTRFFIQALGNTAAWNHLTRLQRSRHWITVGLPVLALSVTIIAVQQYRKRTAPARPAAVETKLVPPLPDLYPDDGLVTNIPRIRIDSSVNLTSPSPEVVEALEAMTPAAPDNRTLATAILQAQSELEAASRFLAAADESALRQRAVTNQEAGATDLVRAGLLLTGSNPASNTVPVTATTNSATLPLH